MDKIGLTGRKAGRMNVDFTPSEIDLMLEVIENIFNQEVRNKYTVSFDYVRCLTHVYDKLKEREVDMRSTMEVTE